MRKQTESQVLGREGERWFQSTLPSQWIYQRPSEDFGIDGIVAIGDDNSVTPYEFGVQIKTSTEWSAKDGHIAVQVRLEIVRYWVARIVPTLLALYDATEKIGYYVWIPQLVSRSDLADDSRRTLALRVPVSSVLDPSSWSPIRQKALQYYDRLASAFIKRPVLASLLRTVHSLAQAHQWLNSVAFRAVESENQQKRAGLLEVAAHRHLLTAVRRLASQINPDCELKKVLDSAAETYCSLCAQFVHPVGELLEERNRTFAIWFGDEKAKELRPQLISIVAELLVGLTSLAARDQSGGAQRA
jgi:Domain of unknown function (DUF4365)